MAALKVGYSNILLLVIAVLLAVPLGEAAAEDMFETLPLPNAGYESAPVDGGSPGWTRNGVSIKDRADTVISGERAYDGKYSLKMMGALSDSSTMLRSETMPAVAGATYRASVQVYVESTGGPNPQLYLEFWNGTQRIHLTRQPISGLIGEWEQVVIEEVAPPGTTGVTVWYYGNTNYTGVSYWDDVVLQVHYPEGVNAPAEPDAPRWANPAAVEEALSGRLSEANVSWWGFDPEDSTHYIQAAIDSGVRRVIIPNVGRDWIIRPIFLRSNLELILEDGVVVTAKKGEYRGTHDSLFSARDVENLTIHGYGATLRMHKEDYDDPTEYEKAQWRMGIAIRGGTNVEIAGLTITETGGDGIYLGRGTKTFNENVVIRDLIADNNYRQGISVISAKNLLIEDSVFRSTSGTAPMAGIDLEPNRPDERLENVVIRNSVFENNHGPGIHMYLAFLDSNSTPVSVLWENVLVRGSTVGVNINYGRSEDFPQGEIVVRNCVVEGSERNGIGIRNKNDQGAMQITFENCIVRDVAMDALINMDNLQQSVPVYLGANREFQGISFHNVTVVDRRARPFLYGELNEPADDAGFTGITGDLKVLNPYGVQQRWDGPVKELALHVQEVDTVVVDYGQAVAHPEYVLEPIVEQLEPVISFTTPALHPPYTTARGVFAPEILFMHFDDVELERVQVLLNGDPVYDSPRFPTPQDIEIDTLTLHDGQHELVVHTWGKPNGRVSQAARFATRNFVLLNDPLEGPKEVAWFGVVYTPVVLEQSDGWEYVSDRPDEFFGDADRKRRQDNTTEYLVWDTPGLYDMTVELYARDRTFENVLRMEVSADKTSWESLDYIVEAVGVSGTEWRKYVVRGATRRFEDVGYARLVLHRSDDAQQIELGHVGLRMIRDQD